MAYRKTRRSREQIARMQEETCKYCGGLIEIRNPRGICEHLYWPDMFTEEAKIPDLKGKVATGCFKNLGERTKEL